MLTHIPNRICGPIRAKHGTVTQGPSGGHGGRGRIWKHARGFPRWGVGSTLKKVVAEVATVAFVFYVMVKVIIMHTHMLLDECMLTM